MSKFNTKQAVKKDYSYEGNLQYEKNATEAWLNMLFSSYLEPQFYENAETQQQRFLELTNSVIAEQGVNFVANAACFARDELGLRSISELVAARLNAEKFDNKRVFFRNFCQRPDDMAEIFAATDMLGLNKSHAMIRGFADYLSTLSPYTLGKYKMMKKQYNIFDIINLCHPKPTPAIDALKNGTLDAPDTWEVNISAAGSDQEEKSKEWKRLVEEGKLGYLALLRNIRNIIQAVPDRSWIEQYLVPAIRNEKVIHKARIYPYQIYTAYKVLEDESAKLLQVALEDAFITACKNLTSLEGKTVVLLDVSGSMEDRMSVHSNITLKEVGAVFAVMFQLAGNDIDIIKFGTDGKKFNKYSFAPFETVKNLVNNENCGYGTDITAAFHLLDKPYDRILLISDMQCMDPKHAYWNCTEDGPSSYREYCKKYGQCHLYSFDLGNYPTQCENPNNPYIHLSTTLNDKVFEFMPYLENMGNLVNYINTHYDYTKSSIQPSLSLAS